MKFYIPSFDFNQDKKYYYFYTGWFDSLTQDFLDILKYSQNLLLVEMTSNEKEEINIRQKKRDRFRSVVKEMDEPLFQILEN